MTDWALRYEVVFYTTVTDYLVYANAQQTINIEIVEALKEMGVEIALPYPLPKSLPDVQ
jgi:small-conductance mechanosensitive channel